MLRGLLLLFTIKEIPIFADAHVYFRFGKNINYNLNAANLGQAVSYGIRWEKDAAQTRSGNGLSLED